MVRTLVTAAAVAAAISLPSIAAAQTKAEAPQWQAPITDTAATSATHGLTESAAGFAPPGASAP